MTDENRAKIREALTWMDHFAKRQCDGTIEHVANEALDALALLDYIRCVFRRTARRDNREGRNDMIYLWYSYKGWTAYNLADTYDSIAEVIAAHGYLADPNDAPRVAHLMRQGLSDHDAQLLRAVADRTIRYLDLRVEAYDFDVDILRSVITGAKPKGEA